MRKYVDTFVCNNCKYKWKQINLDHPVYERNDNGNMTNKIIGYSRAAINCTICNSEYAKWINIVK